MILEETWGYRNRCRACQFLPFSDSTQTLVKMSEQHAIKGYEAEVGCTARISKLKDELATWKNYLLTQRWEIKDMHITRTALIYLVTRATNRVPAGSDTGYLKEAAEPLRAY